MKKTTKPDRVKVSVQLRINGKFGCGYNKKYFRGRESHAFSLDEFARIVFIYERLLNAGSTYAMDGLLQEVAKHLPNTGETPESVFRKYWIDMDKTVDEEFEMFNKGDKGEKFPMFPEQGDYLKSCIAGLANNFNRNAQPVKQAFLYWLYNHVLDGSTERLMQELSNIPDAVKSFVDDPSNKEPQTLNA